MGQENERMPNPLEAPAHTTAKETREADSNAGVEMATPRHTAYDETPPMHYNPALVLLDEMPPSSNDES